MSKHYSRDRSPLTPVRYERTAGHSRSAKSPIGISKTYSDSYKGLNSYCGKSFDKYDKKYSKHDNGYKNLVDSKYDNGQWQSKDDYKLSSSRKTDYKLDSNRKHEYKLESDRRHDDYKINSTTRKHDDYKFESATRKHDDYKFESARKNSNYKLDDSGRPDYYKDSYKKPLRSKYDKDDYLPTLTRERSPKYEKDYFKDDFKRLDKEKYSKKIGKYKEYPSGGSFKVSTNTDDTYYYKDPPPPLFPYKDTHKKSRYSSPDRFCPSSSKSYFAKPSNRAAFSDRSSSYKDDLYADKRYDDYLPEKNYEYKDKYYDNDLSINSKYGSRSFKEMGSTRGPSSHRRINSAGTLDGYLLSNEYSPRNKSSYERYVIGDSVVYGSPGHQQEREYSPSTRRIPRLDDFSPLMPSRSTNNKRYSLTSPRIRRNDSFKKTDRLSSPIRSRRLLSPHRINKTRTSLSRKRLLSPRKNKDDYSTESGRSRSVKGPRSTSRRVGKSSSFDESLKHSRSKGLSVSPPKPLLSIKLPAGSIPRASRMHINQTVSINDQAYHLNGRGTFGRMDGRIGGGDIARLRDRPTKASDLRLWIESRKNVSSRAAKIFPTKSQQSRRENLSAIASRVRLLEARKRVLERRDATRRNITKRPTTFARSKSTRSAPPIRQSSSSKVREARKRSKSPVRKSSKRAPSPEKRRQSTRSKTTKSTTTKRSTTRVAKVAKSSTSKSASSRKTRRSPAPTKRRSSIAQKKVDGKR